MNKPPLRSPAEPDCVGMTPPGLLPDASAVDQRSYHALRLARLFRLNSSRADDRYLLDLMCHYREVAPP